jgi:hypothetical protein
MTMSCPFNEELLKSLEKWELQAARTSLWALKDSPSQNKVTSERASESRRPSKVERMLVS